VRGTPLLAATCTHGPVWIHLTDVWIVGYTPGVSTGGYNTECVWAGQREGPQEGPRTSAEPVPPLGPGPMGREPGARPHPHPINGRTVVTLRGTACTGTNPWAPPCPPLVGTVALRYKCVRVCEGVVASR